MTVPKKQRKSTRRSTSRLSALPTVQGGLTRFAVDRLRRAGIKLQPLLSGVGLTVDQVDEPERRLSASKQIAFLEAAAEALNDDSLGFRLAEQFDLRELGLLYYVMATADTLGDALKRASRYSRITNEAVILEYRGARACVATGLCGNSTPCGSAADGILHDCDRSTVSRIECSSVLSYPSVLRSCPA